MIRLGIAGANSFIGGAVAHHLQQHHPHEDFCIDEIDMRGSAWESLDLSAYDSILYVAGIVPWTLDRKAQGITSVQQEQAFLDSVNAELPYRFAAKAKREGARQLMYLSTSDVYAKSASADPDSVVDLATELAPENTYGMSKLKAEALLGELVDPNFALAILRLPMVYGPGCRGSFAQLARLAAKTPVFPDVKNARSTLYTGNLAELVGILAARRLSGFFLPQDAAWARTSDLVRIAGEAQGNHVRLFSWANKPCMFLAQHNATVRKVFGNFRYDHAASSEELGYQRFGLEEAVRASVEADRDR